MPSLGVLLTAFLATWISRFRSVPEGNWDRGKKFCGLAGKRLSSGAWLWAWGMELTSRPWAPTLIPDWSWPVVGRGREEQQVVKVIGVGG